MSLFSQDDLKWLKCFYSEGSLISWKTIEENNIPPNYVQQILPWLTRLKLNEDGTSLVLPKLDTYGQNVWYGMATDDKLFSQLINEIMSFIGPSYSDFRGESAKLTEDDPLECALKSRFGKRVIKFSASDTIQRESIITALQQYLAVISRRPEIKDRAQRPFGKVRNEFDLALLSGNEVRASHILKELESSGRINAEQQKCLEIRFLAGLGRGEELARNHALLNSVIDISLPPVTLVDLILALYETFIEPIENDADFSHVSLSFKRDISKSYGSLFRERKGIRNPKVLRAFLLSELVQENPDVTRAKSIWAAYPEQGQGIKLAESWLHRLLPNENHNLEPSKSDTRIAQVRQAILDEDYVLAASFCFDLLPDIWAYKSLLRCADESGVQDLVGQVLLELEKVPKIIDNFSEKDKARFAKLKGGTSESNTILINDWITWADFVSTNPDPVSSIAVLRDSIPKWPVDFFLNNGSHCKELARVIGNANSTAAEEVYREALPLMIDFFSEQPEKPTRELLPIYAVLITKLVYPGSLSEDELEITSSLVQSLLMTGPSKNEYQECLTDLTEIIRSNKAPAHLDWVLNISELISFYPAPDGGNARLNIFTEVMVYVESIAHRITSVQKSVFESIAKDYGCFDSITWLRGEAPEFEGAIENNDFNGLIGIYTLTEGAAHRAKSILKKIYPNAKVEINSDFVETDSLVNLAKTADIFVFAWKSSKHQAYYCVKKARHGKCDLILPSGKGASSIIQSCNEAIMQLMPS